MLGIGKNVVAKTTEEVGQRGEVLVAVIAVGGSGCIGAYLVRPSCKLYGVPHAPSATVPEAAAAAFAMLLMVAGPVVPDTVVRAVVTAAENTPVMPVRVNRFEKFVTVPPAVAVETMPRKYAFSPDPPVPIGTVTVALFPLENDAVASENSC